MINVAKSYQGLRQVGEPFVKSGRNYIKVETKTGTIKEVRVYTDKEYARLYPATKIDKSKDPYYKTQKYTLGFDKGYITLIRGITPQTLKWVRSIGAFNTRWWDWYIKSTDEIPDNAPAEIKFIKLPWDPMDRGDEYLKDEKEIIKYVKQIEKGE